MISGIYKINFPNGKSYIGLSNNIQKRINQHNRSARLDNPLLPVHRAIALYGNIEIGKNVEILEEISPENRELLNERERYWIKYYQTCDNDKGYNLTNGGDGAGVGVGNTSAKLNSEQIEEIYDLLLNHTNIFIYEIAKKYNISPEAISEINCGRRYYNSYLTYPLRPDTKFQKGQYVPKGVENHLSKFSQENIDEIYDLLQNSNISLKEIAEQFNVSYATISNINRGLRYKKENFIYPVRKGFTANKKINNQQLLEISQKLSQTKISMKKIAEEYGVSQDTIIRINKGTGIYKQENTKYPIR